MVGKVIRGVQADCKSRSKHAERGGRERCVRFGADGSQTCHRFRATTAINMARKGVELTTIMDRLGWSPSSIKTVQRYMEKAKQELADRDADEKLAE